MGNCTTKETQEELQFLQSIIDFIENTDVSINLEEDTTLTFYGKAKQRNRAQLAMAYALESLYYYSKDNRVVFRVVTEKMLYLFETYKTFMDMLESYEKPFYYPIKDSMLDFLKTLKEIYYKKPKHTGRLIITGVENIQNSLRDCGRTCYLWKNENERNSY